MLYSRILLVAVVFAFLSPAPVRAGRIYQLVDYPAFQNGGTLSGTITVDDAVGFDAVLDIADIVDWSWTAVLNSTSVTASFSEPGAATILAGSLSITASAILLNNPAEPEDYDYVEFRAGNELLSSSDDDFLHYALSLSPEPNTHFRASKHDSELWSGSPPFSGLGLDPWIIAIIAPEPSTASLLLAASPLIFIRRRKKGDAAHFLGGRPRGRRVCLSFSRAAA